MTVLRDTRYKVVLITYVQWVSPEEVYLGGSAAEAVLVGGLWQTGAVLGSGKCCYDRDQMNRED